MELNRIYLQVYFYSPMKPFFSRFVSSFVHEVTSKLPETTITFKFFLHRTITRIGYRGVL